MATIHDVALDANVSPTTVSRYLNHRIELPASTAARIDAGCAPERRHRVIEANAEDGIGRRAPMAKMASPRRTEQIPPRLRASRGLKVA